MAFNNLQPQKADATLYEGDGGGYYLWTAAKTPALVEAAIGAGRLVLKPRGFAFPHYSDTNKIGYVMQGTCTVGLILPEVKEEKIIIINKGDAIPITIKTISWWFNGGDSDVTIIFLGESSQSYTPGLFDYFFLTGAIGILHGFSTDFISKIYSLNDDQSKELTESQPNGLAIKVDASIQMHEISNTKKEEYVIGLDVEATSGDPSLIDNVGLSPKLVGLEPEALLDPYYSTAHEMMYVLKGGGKIQIVGLNGVRVLDDVVEEGQLIVVPKFYVVAMIAGDEGLELLRVSTSPRPFPVHIAGNKSPYKALSSSVLEAALNVSPEFVKIFKSKI